MARSALVAVACGLLFATAGCGGGHKSYSLAPTKACISQRGATIGGKLDFVAQTATGGAFIAHFSDNNWVTFVFGETSDDGQQLEEAYQRFAFPNVQAGLADVLKLYRNVVTLWHEHPSDSNLALVTGCLR